MFVGCICYCTRNMSIILSFDIIFMCLQEKLRVVSVFGSGLLVGAALAVIIPEGVHMLYESKEGEPFICLTNINELYINCRNFERNSLP